MNASKESARKANNELETAAAKLDAAVPDKTVRDAIKTHLIRVQAFVEAAERKLPTEASYARDAKRRKVS